MRRIIAIGLVMVSLNACGGNNSDRQQSVKPSTGAIPGVTVSPELASAVQLAVESAEEAHGVATTRAQLTALYQSRGFAPLWLESSGRPTADAEQAVAALAAAAADGLDPAAYHHDTLATEVQRLREKRTGAAEDLGRFDTALSASLLRYVHDLHEGRIDPKSLGFRAPSKTPTFDYNDAISRAVAQHQVSEMVETLRPQLKTYRDLTAALATYRKLASDDTVAFPSDAPTVKPGASYVALAALHHLLSALGDLPADAPAPAEGTVYGGALVEGMKHFQARHGLKADGVIGKTTLAALQRPLDDRVRQIELSLERLRWLPPLEDGPLIAVNIPMFHLWAWDAVRRNPLPQMNMDVIVGEAFDNETPLLFDRVETVVFRPYWNVPASIAKEELLPKLRKDSRALDQQDMEFVSGQSDKAKVVPISRGALDDLEAGKLRLRQRPGPQNSLGLVKFVFPNDADVYMHGTPATQLFDRSKRDLSHGCIRVADPTALAEWLLHDQGWAGDRIETAMNGEEPQTVKLSRSVPVILFYLTAAVLPEDGSVHFADDIYGQDAALERALAAHPMTSRATPSTR